MCETNQQAQSSSVSDFIKKTLAENPNAEFHMGRVIDGEFHRDMRGITHHYVDEHGNVVKTERFDSVLFDMMDGSDD